MIERQSVSPPGCVVCLGLVDAPLGQLTTQALERLDRERLMRAFASGQSLFHEGMPATHLYCVQTGIVKLFRTDPSGAHHALGLAGPGEMVGYVSILDRRTYAVGASAVTEVKSCLLPREVLFDILRESPSVCLKLIVRLARSLHSAEERCVALALHSATERTAYLLLSLLELQSRSNVASMKDAGAGDTIVLPLKRAEMAELAATTPETISRVLRALERRGMVALGRDDVRIADRAKLERLAKWEWRAREESNLRPSD